MWTKKEQLAILKSLFYIIGADGKFAPQEKKIIVDFMNHFGLNPSDVNQIDYMSQSEMEQIIRGLSYSDKIIVRDNWIATIQCDNDVDSREVDVFIEMAANCGINLAELLQK